METAHYELLVFQQLKVACHSFVGAF